MINLLPPRARTVLSKEYWSRVCIVWLVLFMGACSIGFALLMPSYVLLTSQQRALALEADALEGAVTEAAQVEDLVKEVDDLTAELQPNEDVHAFSAILVAINTAARSGIDLDRYSIGRVEGDIATVSITGTASSREALLSFQSALEASPLFDRAEVPLSDLVRSAELPFSMTLFMASAEGA